MQSNTWFFSLEQPLTPDQEAALGAALSEFAGQWKSHGASVDGLMQIKHHQFIIARSNPGDDRPSGCSIDSLKRGISSILQQMGFAWADSAQVYYQTTDGQIQSTHFSQIRQKIDTGELTPDTQVFDHSLDQSDDLSKWEAPLKQTWLKRFL
ncbi:hypothetical protein [Pontibacter sp. G13]|uniref:hypothetical protein n=1 Tax=Pontibacter sp. G13 TaxID=3074898 RepID=UPI00288A2096|nr:hypothetical protein [Pontibacter sp. G13]WNJ21065.1 hypothetical protein RJD25_11400 [Pontibacter sp. G13]